MFFFFLFSKSARTAFSRDSDMHRVIFPCARAITRRVNFPRALSDVTSSRRSLLCGQNPHGIRVKRISPELRPRKRAVNVLGDFSGFTRETRGVVKSMRETCRRGIRRAAIFGRLFRRNFTYLIYVDIAKVSRLFPVRVTRDSDISRRG